MQLFNIHVTCNMWLIGVEVKHCAAPPKKTAEACCQTVNRKHHFISPESWQSLMCCVTSWLSLHNAEQNGHGNDAEA